MKWILALTLVLTLTNCSKETGDIATPAPGPTSETSESNNLETIRKAKTEYENSLTKLRSSKDKRLEQQKLISEEYQLKTKAYLGALKLSDDQDSEISKVEALLTSDLESYDEILSLIKKLNDSKESLLRSQNLISEIKLKTENFDLSLIRKLNLREDLFEAIEIYKQDARYLQLSFENEFDQSDLDHITLSLQENAEALEIFEPYFSMRNTLLQSEAELSKVEYSSLSNDHTVQALTYEEKFFKTLHTYIEAIETFKEEAAIFLSLEDLEDLDQSQMKVSKTIISLKEIQDTQKAIASDLRRIEYLGYVFPKNIESIHQDNLKWEEKEVYIFTGVFPKKVKWEIGLHKVDPLTNDNYSLEDIIKYNLYEKISKNDFPSFKNLMISSARRIIFFQSAYDGVMPEEKDNNYFKKSKLILDTITIIQNYLNSLPY